MENDLDANLLPDRRYKDYRSAPRSWEQEEYNAAHAPQPRNRYYDPSQRSPHQQFNQYRDQGRAYDDDRRTIGQIRPVRQQHPQQAPAARYMQTYQENANELFQQNPQLFNPYKSNNINPQRQSRPPGYNNGYNRNNSQRTFENAHQNAQGRHFSNTHDATMQPLNENRARPQDPRSTNTPQQGPFQARRQLHSTAPPPPLMNLPANLSSRQIMTIMRKPVDCINYTPSTIREIQSTRKMTLPQPSA